MTFVDDFDDDLTGWTNPSGNFSIATSHPVGGAGNLTGTGDASPVDLWSASGDGLDIYPTKGHEWTMYVRSDTVDAPAAVRIRIYFGLEDATTAPDDDGYYVQINWYSTDNWYLFEDTGGALTQLDSDTAISGDLAADTWYRLEFTWDDGTLGGNDGDITVELYTETGTTAKSTLFANDLSHSGNDINISLEDDDTGSHVQEVDQWEVTNVTETPTVSATGTASATETAGTTAESGATAATGTPTASETVTGESETPEILVKAPGTEVAVDDFDDDLSGWTEDTAAFSISTSDPQAGAGNVETSVDGALIHSSPGDGLVRYPTKGDRWTVFVKASATDIADNLITRIWFGLEQDGIGDADGYDIQINWHQHDNWFLFEQAADGTSTLLDSDSAITGDLAANTWYRLDFTWDDGTLGGADGDITVELKTADGSTTKSTLFANDLNHSGEGVSISVDNNTAGAETLSVDEWEVTNLPGRMVAATETATADERPDFRHTMDASTVETATASESPAVSATATPDAALATAEFPEVGALGEWSATETASASESASVSATATNRATESVPTFVSTARLGDLRLGHAKLGHGEAIADETGAATATATPGVDETADAIETPSVPTSATASATEQGVAVPESASVAAFGTPGATATAPSAESASVSAAGTPGATDTAPAAESSAASAAGTPSSVERTVFPETGAVAPTATPAATEQAVAVDEAAASLGAGAVSVTGLAHIDERAVADAVGSLPTVPETVTIGAPESVTARGSPTLAASETATASEAAAPTPVGEPNAVETSTPNAEAGSAAATAAVGVGRERADISETSTTAGTASVSAFETTPTVSEVARGLVATATPSAVEFAPPVPESAAASAAGTPSSVETTTVVEALTTSVVGTPLLDEVGAVTSTPTIAVTATPALASLLGQRESGAAVASATLGATDVASATETPAAVAVATPAQTERAIALATAAVAAAATPDTVAETVTGSSFVHHDARLDATFDPRRDRDGTHAG